MNLSILLQAAASTVAEVTSQPPVIEESYFSLILKGGWILLPIFLLSLLSIYVIIDRWLVIGKLGKKDSVWLSRVLELIHENKIDKALKFSLERNQSSAQVIAAGLKEASISVEEAEESMQVESRQQISIMENMMSYLSITAAIAPMLGFLGTIFGVIKIFYNISVTNDLAISSIADGLYQKMICSGAGLLVGIIAYSGYYVLNSKIDKVVAGIDKDSNETLKALRANKRGDLTPKNY